MSVLVEHDVARGAMAAVNQVFTSLGRHLICLDEDFRIVYVSPGMRDLLGTESIGPLEGRPIADVLAKELFGPGAPLRDALLAGERREGWRALLQTAQGIRALSITAAPLHGGAPCDPRVRYLVVVLPAEEDHFAAAAAPTILAGLIARSPAMLRVFQRVENLQGSDVPVLLIGERGTGKEVVARAIHEHSLRRRGPFVVVSCAAVPPDLLDSELFGHVRGAFAGAVRDRVGRFELAAHGTLFLDEVGMLPPQIQTKVLQGLVAQTVSARVIASTKLELGDTFAHAFMPIEIPPLRTRREDIEPLARLLLRRVGDLHGRHLRLAPEVLRLFLTYSWPGNVQELESAIEYAFSVSKGPLIQLDDLPAEIAGNTVAPNGSEEELSESQRLRAALESHRWRREETARALGISRATLWRRMREFGLL